MSYLVLARKWRPQIFADLVGQEHVSRTLANAIASGRVHHAFLFTGARGVGKTSAARILAKALNCQAGPAAEPCNICQSCTEIASGQSVDVFEIDGASNTGVDDVRELRETLRYMPSQSRYKIFIIDEVHMLSINAFNALLKTLEEPPDHVKFIFATTEPHKIPVTILSRCQRFDFRKIAAPKVIAQLRRIVDAEQIQISTRALTLIAQRGGGSMRDSLSTLDQVVAFCSEVVADEDVQGLLGMVDRRLLFDALQGCAQHQGSQVFEVIRRVDDLGYSFRQFCQELVEVVRQTILCTIVADPQEGLGLSGDEIQALTALAALASAEDWQRLMGLLIKTEAQLAHSAYPKLLVEMALIRAASLPPARDIGGLIQKIETLQGAAGGRVVAYPVATAVPPPLRVPAVASVPISPISPVLAPSGAGLSEPARSAGDAAVVERESGYTPQPEGSGAADSVPHTPAVAAPLSAAAVDTAKGWKEFVTFAKAKRPRIGSLLEHGSLLKLELPVVRVGFSAGSFLMQQLSDVETKQRLDAVAVEFFGQPAQVSIESLSVQGAAPLSLVAAEKKRDSDRERRLREDALAHPLVKKAVDVFSGTIERVTPIDKGFV